MTEQETAALSLGANKKRSSFLVEVKMVASSVLGKRRTVKQREVRRIIREPPKTKCETKNHAEWDYPVLKIEKVFVKKGMNLRIQIHFGCVWLPLYNLFM